uniref:hypothetical protein n=1 Tax=Microbispora cellulosiformans TaxID=2614688 RepID=UPI0012450DE0|nr:hypothetical protein [Microbispora cellulosiformans]
MLALEAAQESGWNAASWVSVLGSLITLAGVCITGVLTYRASVKSNQATIDAAARAAEREEEKEEREATARRQELLDETVRHLREHLEGIIARLTEEIEYTRTVAQRLREQVNEEQSISDKLRHRVRALEEQVEEMAQTIADLRTRLIADDAATAIRLGYLRPRAEQGGPPGGEPAAPAGG